jgi:hypothetical protein
LGVNLLNVEPNLLKAKRLATTLGLGLAAALSSAFATTYTTSGCFSNPQVSNGATSAFAACSASGSSFGFNDIAGNETITYSDASSMASSSGMIDLGSFQFSSSGTGSGSTFDANFSLGFTSPPAITGTLSAALSGSFNGSPDGAIIFFSANNAIFTTPDGTIEIALKLNPVQINPNNTTATLLGTLTTVPEPMCLGLVIMGSTVLLLLRFRFSNREP